MRAKRLILLAAAAAFVLSAATAASAAEKPGKPLNIKPTISDPRSDDWRERAMRARAEFAPDGAPVRGRSRAVNSAAISRMVTSRAPVRLAWIAARAARKNKASASTQRMAGQSQLSQGKSRAFPFVPAPVDTGWAVRGLHKPCPRIARNASRLLRAPCTRASSCRFRFRKKPRPRSRIALTGPCTPPGPRCWRLRGRRPPQSQRWRR